MRSWRVLGPLDRLLGSLEALLEPPGALLAASWSLFECSWGGHGASWAPLEPSWRRPKHHKDNMSKKGQLPDPTTQTYRALMGTFWELQIDHKRHPKRVKISYDFQERKSCSSRASWSRLGPILRHFGRHLGAPKIAAVSAGVVFGENSCF